MEQNLINKIALYHPPRCTKHQTIQQDIMNSICLNNSCEQFFSPLCSECLQFHNHSAQNIKGLQSTIKILINQINKFQDQQYFSEENFLKGKNNSQKDLKQAFQNISNAFIKLSENCIKISNNILQKSQEIFSQEQLVNPLKEIFKNISTILKSNNEKVLHDNLNSIKKFVIVNNNSDIKLNIDNNPILDIDQTASNYGEKINQNYKLIKEKIEQLLTESQTYQSYLQQKNLKNQQLFSISKYQDSQLLEELEQGIMYKGSTSKQFQIIFSNEIIKSGKYILKFKIQNLSNFTEQGYHCLMIGLIKDCENLNEIEPSDQNGCHKCLFNARLQNQMIMQSEQGSGVMPNFCLREYINEGDIIQSTFDYENEIFKVEPIINPKLVYYQSNLKKCKIKENQWRFCILFKNCQHIIKILSLEKQEQQIIENLSQNN